jgi:acyl carrier protein
MGTPDSGEMTAQPELGRRQAMSLVSDALTAIVPDLPTEGLHERQELDADLGLDSLSLARLLIELEGKLGVQLMDEFLMNVELVTVADLVNLVERTPPPAAK